ncbi:helix-turn-helix domain-containing protein [Streptosporangium sp. NPDC087985]|uniref:AraC-like ligand-binding domain-containing protein n=1 Tax=Streptosporangium sp. NPDC087985 TaxID=3366196 RepID=UPI0038300F5D
MAERFDSWLDCISRMVAPVKVTCNDPADFRGEIRLMNLGAVHISSQRVSSCEGHRTSRMIRQSDPELFQLVLQSRGGTAITQDRRTVLMRPLDLTLYHTSRPYHVRTGADEDAHGIMVVFPGSLLPLPLDKVERLTATPFSGSEGVGALLSGFLTRLTTGTDQYGIPDLLRLGTTLIDLLTVMLAHRLDADRAVPPTTHQHALLLRIHAFIQQHLADPCLSPAMIATACGVSLRYLQRLFQTQDTTVAGWIRSQRLERCRRDLADPAHRHRPIYAIAAQWGFTAATHFTRVFQTAYGLTPQDYRRHTTNSAAYCL